MKMNGNIFEICVLEEAPSNNRLAFHCRAGERTLRDQSSSLESFQRGDLCSMQSECGSIKDFKQHDQSQ